MTKLCREGSSFHFTLKQKVTDRTPLGDYEATLRQQLEVRKKYHVKFTAQDAHILVVDDNEMNLMVFKSLIKQTLINADAAISGDAGIALTRTKKYDLIFLDHMMPEKDGIETLQEIRADEENPNAATPMICLTANAISGARDTYLAAGFNGYLTKPINASALENTLIDFLPEELIEETESDKPVVDMDFLAEIYNEIRSAADEMDCEKLDSIFEEMSEYAIPESEAGVWEKLKKACDAYDYNEILSLLG